MIAVIALWWALCDDSPRIYMPLWEVHMPLGRIICNDNHQIHIPLWEDVSQLPGQGSVRAYMPLGYDSVTTFDQSSIQ